MRRNQIPPADMTSSARSGRHYPFLALRRVLATCTNSELHHEGDWIKSPLNAAVLGHTKDFAALEDEWEELYRHLPSATPFQSWAWLYSWWEHYGEGYDLRIITLRDGEEGLLVGLIPLMLERRWGFGRLLFVGTGRTRYLDILVREGRETQIVEVGIGALRRLGGWHLLDLQELRPEAAAWHLFRQWSGPAAQLWQSDCLVIDAKPWDELVMSLPKSQRTPTRRTIRRANEDGLHRQLASSADAEGAARRLLALSREQWRDRWQETSPGFWGQNLESYLQTTARRITSRGLGGVSEFWRNNEVIVSCFLLFGRDFVAAYMAGANQAALKRYSFGSLYMWDAMEIVRERQGDFLSLLQGKEPYKLRWAPREVPNHRVFLGRSSISFIPYLRYQVLRSRVKEYLESEEAPEWARDFGAKYRGIRARAVWRAQSLGDSRLAKSVTRLLKRR